MTKKYFQILIGSILLLIAALFVFDNQEQSALTKESKLLLSGINSDQIAKVAIEQGTGKVEIEQSGDSWGIVERAGYPADINKLRSLLLKLVDLKVSQKVTSNLANFERLGVEDKSYLKAATKGPTKITLLDSSSKELAVILLGERKRKNGKKEEGLDESSGQFIRKAGADEVYLLAEPIEVTVSPESMIVTDLLSVPSAKVKRVLQQKLNGASKEKQFEMLSVKEADGKFRFDLDLEPNQKQEIQKTVVDSVASGLENVRIQDVVKSSADSDKIFDHITTYELSTGAVYQVETGTKDGKGFARYSVSFNKTLADNTSLEIESLNSKKKAEYDQKKKEAEEKKEVIPAEFVPLKADVVTEEDIAKEEKKFSAWVFELPAYQSEKYLKTPADLIKDKAAAAPAS